MAQGQHGAVLSSGRIQGGRDKISTTETIFAGFGGQGMLLAGKLLAYLGLYQDKQVSWLPSYGPEMRGGTANCTVCVSDQPSSLSVCHRPGYPRCDECSELR